MFKALLKQFKEIIGNEGGYYGKDRKRADAQAKALADQQAAVLREQIASQERIARETNEAQMRASHDAAIGSIVAGALGAHTTTETIKQLLPSERGAETIQSWELAQKWNTSREMQESGYSNVAIEYALNGKSYKPLYKDAQFNSMRMAEENRRMMVQSIQSFGIRSSTNPYGVDVTQQQWIDMHSMKAADEMLKVDPEQARQRQQAFDAWETDMRSKGMGILVDVYKNPQLAGQGITAMKGKEAALPEELLPMLQSLNGGAGQGGGSDYGGALAALTRGEKGPHTAEIEWAMKEGIIDKYGMVATDKLMQFIPPELQNSPEFDPHRQLTPEETARLTDDFMKFSTIKIDPKLYKEESIGSGVVRKYKFNADGSVAGSALSGYMTNAMGEQMAVTIPGDRMQDWMDQQSKMGGMGPLFPAMLATNQHTEKNATFEADFWGGNALSQPNSGNKSPEKATKAQPAQHPQLPSIYNTNQGAPTQASNTVSAPTTPPTGYAGAPLAAGE